MVVCFEIEENLEKKSNSLFDRGVFFTFDMSTGVISKYVNWLMCDWEWGLNVGQMTHGAPGQSAGITKKTPSFL